MLGNVHPDVYVYFSLKRHVEIKRTYSRKVMNVRNMRSLKFYANLKLAICLVDRDAVADNSPVCHSTKYHKVLFSPVNALSPCGTYY